MKLDGVGGGRLDDVSMTEELKEGMRKKGRRVDYGTQCGF